MPCCALVTFSRNEFCDIWQICDLNLTFLYIFLHDDTYIRSRPEATSTD